jgi:signal-transduction protein with cAMP-binding, CBS, and nucleotidyltransferase domain
MKDMNVGAVLVVNDDALYGIVTDRDIAIRVVAVGRNPERTRLGDICSREARTLGPESKVRDAVSMMREHAVRRIPIVEQNRPVGIVALGDLAMDRDPQSTLAAISSVQPTT